MREATPTTGLGQAITVVAPCRSYVRGTGIFPDHEVVGVRLLIRSEDLGFGLGVQDEYRHAEILAENMDATGKHAHWPVHGSTRNSRLPGRGIDDGAVSEVDSEVIGIDQSRGVQGVVQRGQPRRRLRTAANDNVADAEAPQYVVGVVATGDHPHRLSEDVVRVVVARMAQGVVPLRVAQHQATLALDSQVLGAHADNRISIFQHAGRRWAGEHGVETGRHVVPVDHHDPIEAVGRRTFDEKPDAVRRALLLLH
jgi:hypothetical protein